MSQPRKPLNLSGAEEILKNERKPLDLSGAEAILKKKGSSTGTGPSKATGSAGTTGSLDGADSKGFPKWDTNGVAPGIGEQPKEESAVVKGKPKTFRLPTVAELQNSGMAPPPSEIAKQTESNKKDLYDLDASGKSIVKKVEITAITPGYVAPLESTNKATIESNNKAASVIDKNTKFRLEGQAQKAIADNSDYTEEVYNFTKKDQKNILADIDKKIEDNDLNLDHPYLYYSTFDKPEQAKDNFVESNYGEEKLAGMGINPADFDGFLNKIKSVGGSSYKSEYLDKEANGLFEGKGADASGGYDIQLAQELQKQRMLSLYMQDINSRDFAKRKLKQEKVNLGKSGADREEWDTQYTLFDNKKVGEYFEKEMPILTQKLKERDVENLKIYEQHKNGDAGWLYGGEKVLKAGWNGFVDRVNQTSSTMLDKIGLDSLSQETKLLNEERQIQRPNTREVGYASGMSTKYDGVNYLVTKDGQIIDQDKGIRVTDMFMKPTYDKIVNQSKTGKEDSLFSMQGSAITLGGVLGDMVVQVVAQRGIGLASTTGSLLSKIPIPKGIASAIVAQSALGYSQGLEQTYKAAIEAGIDENTAKILAVDSAQRTAILYAVTAPISPQTKAVEGIFGSGIKESIKKAVAAYAQTGKKGFIASFKTSVKALPKNVVTFMEEGGKEVVQENIQQEGEAKWVNAATNREAGKEIAKETISADEYVNTSILSFAAGGLMTIPGMFSSTDKLKTLQQLSQDPTSFEKNLNELVSKGVFTNEKADILRKDVKIYSNQSNKIPKNLNKDIAMDVMSDLQDISDLETKKKGLDKSFHEELDSEIEVKRANIKAKMNESSKKPQTNEESPTATNTDNAPLATVPELDIAIERGGVFSGEFLRDYDFLAEGSEHSVYRSKDGNTVIKIGEPHNSNETYQARVDDALTINNLLGDGSLKVIGTYKSPNGTINPVYSQSFVDGKIASQEQIIEHLTNNGFTQTGNDSFTINQNGKTLEISDTSDNFIIDSDGAIIAIDAAIREIQNEATPPTNPPADANVRPGDKPEIPQGKNQDVQPAVKPPTNKGEVGKKLIEVNKAVFGLDDKQAKANAVVMEKTIATMAERAGVSVEEMYDTIDFEKGDADTAKELSKKGKALFQIAGENANLKEELRDKLKRAQELEKNGKSEKEIWIATGWEKGSDGKWRVEFDDSKMQLKDGYDAMRGYPLDEAIEYKELFDLYPGLKKVRFSVIPRLGSMNGAFMPAKNLIMINGQLSASEVKSTLLHEIQHIIQREEGFATGGTPKMAVDYLNSKISRLTIAKNIPSFVAKAADKLSKSLFSGIDIKGSKDNFVKEIKKAKNKLSKGEWDVYQSIAGEVESRNVQNRMEMTVEERKKTSLSETENKILPKEYSDDPNQYEKIGRDEQIVLFQGEQGAMLAEDGRFIIYALTDPNVSTPLHELAHVYEHYLTDAERATVLKDAGHDAWTRETSEFFARSFEKYLADGIAPNAAMKTVFENFKKWMTEIYKGVTDIDMTVSPEMKKIFDVMLGEKNTTTKTVNYKSFGKETEFTVETDDKGNVIAIRNSKNGKIVPKFAERKVKVSKKNPTGKKLGKNANYAKIESFAKGSLTENERNELDKAEQKIIDAKILTFEANDEYELALKYVAEGGKVKLSDARSETGEKNAKAMKWAAGFNKEADLPTIENVAEKLMPYDSALDESKIRQALIDIFSTFESLAAVKEHLLEVYEENSLRKKAQELAVFLNSLSDKEFALYQAVQAEDSYLEELTIAEVEEYYNQKIDENEQGQQEYAKGFDADQKPTNIAQGDEGAQGKQGTSEEKVVASFEDVYNSNEEISSIGTKEQYSQYIETIFPDSEVKDIVYHGGNSGIESFDKEKLGEKTSANSAKLGFFFSDNKDVSLTYIQKSFLLEIGKLKELTDEWQTAIDKAQEAYDKQSSNKDFLYYEAQKLLNKILDFFNKLLKHEYLTLDDKYKKAIEEADKLYGELKGKQDVAKPRLEIYNTKYFFDNYKIEKETQENKKLYAVKLNIKNPLKSDFEKDQTDGGRYYSGTVQEALNKNNDSAILSNVVDVGAILFDQEIYDEVEKKRTRYSAKDVKYEDFYKGTDYVVFEPEQIYILGSKKDIEGFKEYVNKNNAKTPPAKEKITTANSPELKEVNVNLEKAYDKLKVAKEALDRKARALDKELMKDNEDIFGERKSQDANKLFDERVDADARNKATEKERQAVKDADAEIKKLQDLKAKIESGEIVSSNAIAFEGEVKAESDLGEKARQLAKKVRENGILPDWLQLDKEAREGLKNNGIGLNEAFAKALETFATVHDATKDFARAVEEAFQHLKDWYDTNGITFDEKDLKEKFSNHVKTSERQAENLLNRALSENISEEDAYNEVKNTFEKARAELNNKKLPMEYVRDAYRNFVKRFTDRQYLAKTLLNKSGMKAVQNLIVNSHGASGKAKIQFEEAYDKIYKKLTTKERATLDEIIQAKRFIAIDNNREARGLEPVSHPNFIDKNKSEKFLRKLEQELGTEKYNDLVQRADAYFDVYKGLLKDMLDNGLISKESFDSMSDVDYQPRVFLQFVTDFNGDLETNKRTNNLDSGGLSSEQIKSMSEGDASSLVLNSEWLLMNSLLSRSKAMAMNNINKRFMTGEFQKAKARFEALDPKNLKGDDVRFYKYFEELNSKVIDNPFIGKSESGVSKYLYDKTPANFAKAYYYVDGQRHEFFLEKELHESWNDNIEGFLSSNAKEFISYASGAALIKAIATGNNPAFPIVNTPRDFMFTATFSDQYSSIVPKAMLQIAKDVWKSIQEIRKPQSDVLKKYIEYGGAMDFLSSQGTLKKESLLGQVLDKSVSANTRDIAKDVFSKVTLHKISAYSEMMFRLGIFQRSIQNQLKEMGLSDISQVTDKQQRDDLYNQAVTSAREILDFNQGGVITKDLESVIPYINVAFQGGKTAFKAFEKDPVGTTSRVLQVATLASAVPIGISLALISAMKSDDDDDKSAYEVYLHALSGISKYQKMKYMNIVTGLKNDDGEYQVIKIAKAQELSPVMSVTDDIYNNFIRSLAGQEKKSAKSITEDALFTFNSNVMPVDVTSPAGLITRTPAVKATLTYATGYDFFREEPLSMDIGKVPKPVEGITMSSTEDFYKKLGEKYGLSPIRSKAFVESLITGPSTNPFIGMLYGGADAASSDKDMKQIGTELFKTIYKSTGKRVISYSSDFNRQLAGKKELQDKIDGVNMEKYREKAKFNALTKQFLDKEITRVELNAEINKLPGEDRKRMQDKVKDKMRMKDVDGTILDIKYEQGNEAKALMMMHYYGDIFDGSKDSRDVVRQMRKAKGILTPATMREYNKIKKQLGTKKTPN